MGALVSSARQPQRAQRPRSVPDNREGDGKDGPTLPKGKNESQVNSNRLIIVLGDSIRPQGEIEITSSSNDADASRLDRELATSNVNRAATLIGSSMAIFTFLLFFLYPRFSTGQIDPVLFQVTLGLIVFTIFAFGFSGLYFYGLVGISKLSNAKRQLYFRRANLFFVLGLLFAVAEPALILFTVGLTLLGLAALILWLLYTYFIVRQARELSNH